MVRHIPCGTFVNESERIACERLRVKLQGAPGEWIILSNLLELKDGVQISGVAQEGVFANLEIFTQRLAREYARSLHGWHPTEEEGYVCVSCWCLLSL